MSRTITALFDNRSDADAGAARLVQAGIDVAHVHVHDQSSYKADASYSTREDKGLWASIKNAFLPDSDRHAYEEGVRRGGFLLTADVDDDKTPAAVAALEDANSVDLDERSNQWRTEGWEGPSDDVLAGADEAALYGSRDTDYNGSRYRSYSSRTSPDVSDT